MLSIQGRCDCLPCKSATASGRHYIRESMEYDNRNIGGGVNFSLHVDRARKAGKVLRVYLKRVATTAPRNHLTLTLTQTAPRNHQTLQQRQHNPNLVRRQSFLRLHSLGCNLTRCLQIGQPTPCSGEYDLKQMSMYRRCSCS